MEDLERLRVLGEGFNGRLSENEIKFALGYIDFNEAPLALDALCNYICECDVSVSMDEYGEIILLNGDFGYPLGWGVISYLKNLISNDQ
ncbi:MafI family immunity protein [Burkholderia cepacia]|uniref:MafI family immunity protein n=1 Tax=Burkholderia cepacia TaxID=292 RepID=UPI001C934C5A|nr:MafI family immunity protein [Burkholderia cepacia]MBY4711351.1 MafI family immunity protein [Burkholderia cepacia]MBY4734574.1 MafI family immunity protein [Burkholderia cepacia]MBY4744171.1 MafI family immunity protein [Burkholderia cepacia]MBY4757606.1 MafI family immunity protein [Burkholderia cepacia]MBY4774709.1 MafI family immunity protein [Burkholderia cepacia]